MSALPRRSFLSGLASLPLIGGSLALIGQPTAAAVPVTEEMLRLYGAFCWHDFCRSILALDRVHGRGFDWARYYDTAVVHPLIATMTPQQNAPVVLSAVGLPIT